MEGRKRVGSRGRELEGREGREGQWGREERNDNNHMQV